MKKEFEQLVENLARELSEENIDSSRVENLALRLNDRSGYGQKKETKNNLMNKLGYDTKDDRLSSSLQTITESIQYLRMLGIKEVSKVVADFPPILSLTVEDTLRPKVEYLMSIGVKQEDIGKVVTKHPQVLSFSIDNTMKQRIEYLKSIGVKHEDIGKVVTDLPQVLSYSIDDNMKQRIEYLKSIGVKQEDIGKVVTKHPPILTLSVDDVMKQRVDYLSSIGFKQEDIGKIVTRYPQVLALDIDNNLKPTYEFLRKNFRTTIRQITNTPVFLGCSLNKRIKPRYEFLKQKKPGKKYSAGYVLKISDEKFCKRFGINPQEYQYFKQKYIMENTRK